MIKFYVESLVDFREKKLGNIIYIGAGSGRRVLDLITLNPKALTAVEANCQLFNSLEKKFKKIKLAKLYNEWVFPGVNTEGLVKIYNNPRYNSIQVNGESNHGNAVLESEINVSGSSLNEVLLNNNLSREYLNFLILDVDGAENFISGVMQDFNIVKNLDFIISACPKMKSGSLMFRCKEYIRHPTFGECGYNIFQKNKSYLTEAKRSKEQLENLSLCADKKERELGEKVAKFNKQLDEMKTEIENLKITLTEKESTIQKLSEQYDLLKRNSDQQCSELSNQIDALKKLEQSNTSTVDLTSRLNLKLQSDLDELRRKYSEKIEVEDELISLVNELYLKLKQASEFYQALELEYPEIVNVK